MRLPSSAEEGWPRHQEENGAATSDGADGVVLVKRYVRFPDQHHPVCATKDASHLFSLRAATPPQLRRGTVSSMFGKGTSPRAIFAALPYRRMRDLPFYRLDRLSYSYDAR